MHKLEEGLECTCEVRVELMVVIRLEEVFRVLGKCWRSADAEREHVLCKGENSREEFYTASCDE